jgi:hypothetical protein
MHVVVTAGCPIAHGHACGYYIPCVDTWQLPFVTYRYVYVYVYVAKRFKFE